MFKHNKKNIFKYKQKTPLNKIKQNSNTLDQIQFLDTTIEIHIMLMINTI